MIFLIQIILVLGLIVVGGALLLSGLLWEWLFSANKDDLTPENLNVHLDE